MQQIDAVRRYYKSTTLDYHAFWTGKKDLAIHFGYYDEEANTHHKALLRMNAVLASQISITSQDKVLDAGCGYGGSSLWLAKNIGCTVTGINIVPFQIERARREAKNRHINNTEFVEADYAHTPFSSDSFDVFWGLESIVHAKDKRAVLKEAHRVLRSAGRLMIAEYLLRESPPLNVEEMQELEPWLQGWAMPSLETIAHYRAMLEKAGFKNIQFHDITEHVLPSLNVLRRLLYFGLPVGRTLTMMHIFSKSHLGNIEGSAAQVNALEKGYWQYIVIIAEK